MLGFAWKATRPGRHEEAHLFDPGKEVRNLAFSTLQVGVFYVSQKRPPSLLCEQGRGGALNSPNRKTLDRSPCGEVLKDSFSLQGNSGQGDVCLPFRTPLKEGYALILFVFHSLLFLSLSALSLLSLCAVKTLFFLAEGSP